MPATAQMSLEQFIRDQLAGLDQAAKPRLAGIVQECATRLDSVHKIQTGEATAETWAAAVRGLNNIVAKLAPTVELPPIFQILLDHGPTASSAGYPPSRAERWRHEVQSCIDLSRTWLEALKAETKTKRSQRPRHATVKRGRTVNERMKDKAVKEPDARYWSARMWASALGCRESTVADTACWKEWQPLSAVRRRVDATLQ